jgi:hypothetical protein
MRGQSRRHRSTPTTPDAWLGVTRQLTDRPAQFGLALTNTLGDGEEWWTEL